MTVLAGNITDDTIFLLHKLLEKNHKFNHKLDLSNNSLLIRLALINLDKHFPPTQEIQKYKASLLTPSEFDYYLESRLKENEK